MDTVPATREQRRFGIEGDEHPDIILPFIFVDGKKYLRLR